MQEEREIWENQFKSVPFSKLHEAEILAISPRLIAKTCITTGWQLPDDTSYKQVIYEQFSKKIKEDYGSLNIDEIEYAFRKYGTTVKDWGKSFNLSLVDEVLIPYINKRAEVREFISKTSQPELPKSKDCYSWKEHCEYRYQQYLQGQCNIRLWPVEIYEALVGPYLAGDMYEDYLLDARKDLLHIFKQYETPLEKELYEKHAKEIMAEGLTNWMVIAHAKRMATAALFSLAKKRNFKNLFVQE